MSTVNESNEAPPRYLSASQLAIASGVHPFLVSRLISAGRLKPDGYVGRRGFCFKIEKIELTKKLLHHEL